jgi:hypothetical protein
MWDEAAVASGRICGFQEQRFWKSRCVGKVLALDSEGLFLSPRSYPDHDELAGNLQTHTRKDRLAMAIYSA